MSVRSQVYFVTGFPGALSLEVAARLASRDAAEVRLLVSEDHLNEAKIFTSAQSDNISIVEGSSDRIDFGLSGADFLSLAEQVTAIVHLALPHAPGSSLKKPGTRAMAREVIELGLAAKRLTNIVVLSHLDVAGTAAGIFAERDLDVGQSFTGPAGEDRFRGERVYRRFMDALPITVARTGWIAGQGVGLCPLVDLLLAVEDPSALSLKDPESMLHAIDLHSLAELLAQIAGADSMAGARTLHLTFAQMPTLLTLLEKAHTTARELAPAGYEFSAGARRVLRRKKTSARWSMREFFKRQPYRSSILTTLTERRLEQRGLELPKLSDAVLKRLVADGLTNIVGAK